MLVALVLTPFLGGALAFALPGNRWQPWVLVVTAAAHLALVAASLLSTPAPVLGGWLQLDALGRVFLTVTSLLFFVAAVYGLGYLQREINDPKPDFVTGALFSNAPARFFVGCMLMFLAAMTLVTVSHHFGVMWIAVEATTLASAPLIYFHRHHRSLEATWKYLLICSVGIAIALLGTFFVAIAAPSTDGETAPLLLDQLLRLGPTFHTEWLKAAFILLLVGYGTKMGLAPFHTWLPDAHSESPSLVSALMSGALLNCAFLGILRAYQVMHAAGLAQFAQGLLVLFGLISMGVAAVFIIGQADYKRMLAYSSVEHMGILALGVGIGGAATFGAMFHVVNHSLIKGLLFLVAGNVLAAYKTTSVRGVRGMLSVLPVSGVLWTAGFLAIVGLPPFGSFLSEFTILQASFTQGQPVIAALYLALLAIVFIGMATVVLRMAQGEPWAQPTVRHREAVLSVAPPVVLLALALLAGLWIPTGVETALHQAAGLLGGA